MQKIFLCLLPVMIIAGCQSPAKQETGGDIERNGVKISYTTCGEGDTTLLFIHGWCINKTYWQPQLQRFCPRYKVVAIDLPGFGQSGRNRSNWTFGEYAVDVKAVIDKLHLKNVIAIGHSMSGDLLLKAATQYPQAFIALVGIDNLHNPGTTQTPEQLAETDRFFDTLRHDFKRTLNNDMKASLFQPGTDTAIVNRVMNDAFSNDTTIAVAVLNDLMSVAQQEQAMMQRLSQKLYLINSDVFPTAIDSLNKYCRKGCEVFLVHGTGHYPMLEKTAEFNDALEKVIQRVAVTSDK
jgi:pimeloyl-ACP methyl ester carboxylesterase